jgi:hypothetical protein
MGHSPAGQAATYSYACFESNPCCYTLTESWVLFDTWGPIHPAELAHGGGVLSRTAYEARFGHDVPPLPALAFTSKGGHRAE